MPSNKNEIQVDAAVQVNIPNASVNKLNKDIQKTLQQAFSTDFANSGPALKKLGKDHASFIKSLNLLSKAEEDYQKKVDARTKAQRDFREASKGLTQAKNAKNRVRATQKELDDYEAATKRYDKASQARAKAIAAAVDSSGKQQLTGRTTFGQLLGDKLPQDLKALKGQVVTGQAPKILKSIYTDLQKITSTAVLGDKKLIARGHELLTQTAGLGQGSLKRLLRDPERRKEVEALKAFYQDRNKQFQAVSSKIQNAVKDGTFNEKSFEAINPFLTQRINHFKDQIQDLNKLGRLAKSSQRSVDEINTLRDKLTKAGKARLDKSGTLDVGRQALAGSPAAISGISRKEVGASIAYLQRYQSVLEKSVNLNRQRAASGSALGLERFNRDLSSLDEVNHALQVGQGRFRGFTSIAHQAAQTLRLFFRYAIGYGALYQALGAVTALTRGLVELDDALVSIRAISGATADQMVEVESAIKRIAVSTKFNVAEIARAAQTLSQAGVQPNEIGKSLEAVALFASATNTTLDTSADLISTVRNVFTDLTDGKIADQLTKAVNISKLTGEDLKTILSRGVQVAKAYNVTSEQFLSAAAVLRNAGIKASTVSTGLRQTVLELLSPDAKTIKVLQQRYSELGENLDVSAIKSRFFSFRQSDNPLFAVLTELKRLGATGSAKKLFQRVFDVRAENVINALAENLDQLEGNLAKLSTPGSAAFAAEVQMTGLGNSLRNLGAVILSVSDNISGNLVESLAEGTRSFTSFLQIVDKGITKIKAESGGGVGGTFLASLVAGGTAAAKTQGGVGAKALTGLGTGLATGGLVGGAQAAGLGKAGDVAGALSIIFTASQFLGAIFSKLGGEASGLSGAKFTKDFAPSAISKLKGFFAKGGLIRGFFAGPVGIAFSVLTGIYLAYQALSKANLDSKIQGLSEQYSDIKGELDKAEATLDDLDAEKGQGFAAKIKEVSDGIASFDERVANALSVSSLGSPQQREEILNAVKALGGADLGTAKAGKLVKALNDSLEGVFEGSVEVGSKLLRDLQDLGSAADSGETQLKSFVDEVLDLGKKLQDSDINDPEVSRKINAVTKALGSVGGLPKTIDDMVEFLNVFISASKTGLEKKTQDLRGLSEGKQRQIIDAQIRNASNNGTLDKFVAQQIAANPKGTPEDNRVLQALSQALSKLEERSLKPVPETSTSASIQLYKDREFNKDLVLARKILSDGLERGLREAAERQEEFISSLLGIGPEIAALIKEAGADAGTLDSEGNVSSAASPEQIQQRIEQLKKGEFTQGERAQVDLLTRLLNIFREAKDRGLDLTNLPKTRQDLIDQKVLEENKDGELVLTTDTGKNLQSLGDTARTSTRADRSFTATDTTSTQLRLDAINREIKLAQEAGDLSLISNELLQKKNSAERLLLRRKLDDILAQAGISSVDQATEEVRQQINQVTKERVTLERNYTETLKKAQDDAEIAAKELVSRKSSLELDATNAALEQLAVGTAAYDKALDKQTGLALRQLDIGYDIERTKLEHRDASQKELDLLKQKLDLDVQDLERRREEAAFRSEIERINREFDKSQRPTEDEVFREVNNIPDSDPQRLQDLDKQAADLSAKKAGLETLQAGADKDSDKYRDLQDQLDAIEDSFARINAEKRRLTSSVGDQAAIGFDPDVIRAKLDNMQDSMKNLGDTISTSLANAIDGVGDAFVDAIDKGENFLDSLADLARNTLLEISRAIIKAQLNQLFGSLLSGTGLNIPGLITPPSAQPAPAPKPPAEKAAEGVSAITTGEFDPIFGRRNKCCDELKTLPQQIGGLGQTFSSGFDSFLGFFTDIGGGIVKAISALVSGTSDGFSSLLGSFGGGGGASSGGGSDSNGWVQAAITAAKIYFGGAKDGGVVGKFAKGGVPSMSRPIKGRGTGTSDSIPAMVIGKDGKPERPIFVANGEGILTAKALAALGGERFLDLANSGKIQGFAQGGMVDNYRQQKVVSPVDSLKQSLNNPSRNKSGDSSGTRVINVLDPNLVSDYMSSSEGEEIILNVMRRNPNAV